MSAQLHRSTNCGGPNSISITSWLLFAAIGVVVSGIALHSVLYGPAMRETAERLRAEQTARENRKARNDARQRAICSLHRCVVGSPTTGGKAACQRYRRHPVTERHAKRAGPESAAATRSQHCAKALEENSLRSNSRREQESLNKKIVEAELADGVAPASGSIGPYGTLRQSADGQNKNCPVGLVGNFATFFRATYATTEWSNWTHHFSTCW
jgi:hypothetical protein